MTYRTYSTADLNYMRLHCHDSPKAVSVILNAPYSTVAEYLRQMRKDKFVRSKYPPKKYYAIYLRKTDELVCSGSAEECAKELGVSMKAFYSLVGRATTGRSKKWEVYVEPYKQT